MTCACSNGRLRNGVTDKLIRTYSSLCSVVMSLVINDIISFAVSFPGNVSFILLEVLYRVAHFCDDKRRRATGRKNRRLCYAILLNRFTLKI